jgi:hypothetical protein
MPIQSVGVRVRRFLLSPIVVLLVSLCAHSQEVGTLTLLKDTPLHVIRGVSMLQGIEGMRLRQGDILETGPAPTAQAQLEFTGGAIVELGPSTQVLLLSQTGTTAETAMLTGWLKGETTAGTYRYSSPLVTATTKGGNVLLHVTADSAEVFVERGTASVGAGNAAATPSSTEKIFFSRKAGKPIVPAGRPSAEFIGAMPVSFRDEFPSRLARFAAAKPPVPKADHDVSYAEIERWLTSSWGRGLVTRFKPRIQDSAFRQAIEAHLAALPGWEPVLHPNNTTP